MSMKALSKLQMVLQMWEGIWWLNSEKSPLRPFTDKGIFIYLNSWRSQIYIWGFANLGSNLIVVCSLAEVYIFSSIHKCDYLTRRWQVNR